MEPQDCLVEDACQKECLVYLFRLSHPSKLVLQGNRYRGRAQCAVAAIAALSLAERLVLKRTDGSREKTKKASHNVLLETFITKVFGNFCGIPHIEFPPLPLICAPSVACEFHGLASDEGKSFSRPGLLAVLREARGWAVEPGQESDINLIVRDLLWLKCPDDLELRRGKITGLYFSAIDHLAVYTLNAELVAQPDYLDSGPQRHNVVIIAKLEKPGHHTHHFYFFFPVPARGTDQTR
ncbi:MAG: hypothetical protein JOZ60_07350 [Verrucomicrobia bacterium]|nr:hypothetical protein [Verrucomicrobiota bacterium]